MATSTNNAGADVLVAGAGPVGLTLAHELARRGIQVRLIDAAAGPACTSRALATHARSLEVYDQMGLLEDLLPRGRKVEHFSLHQGGRRLIRFDTDYSQLPTRFPFTLMVDQTKAEDVLRTACARLGVTPEWGVCLRTFEEGGASVTALLDHGDGVTETVTPSWLAGCDGAHSTVRRRLGLPLIGDSTETWLIADAQVDCGLPQDSIHWLNTRPGTVMLVPFPEPGRWRLLDTADADYSGDDEAVRARFERKITKAISGPVRVHRPSWVSVFTIQQRMIPAMRSKRCFLAGDAAHVHSPASGQGLNTGLQDAYNLAWKLAMVVNGQADEDLLETYGAERVPIGRALLDSTRTATGLVALRQSMASAVMPAGLAVLDALRPVKHRLERKIMGGMSALGVSYPDSALTIPTALPGPRPGYRIGVAGAASAGTAALLEELRDPRWTLLIFDGGAARPPAPAVDWLSVRTVVTAPATAGDPPHVLPDPDGALAAALQAGPGHWHLVRPDGYLAARGTDPGALAAAVAALPVRVPAVSSPSKRTTDLSEGHRR